jgi:Phosphodiester glycosidase
MPPSGRGKTVPHPTTTPYRYTVFVHLAGRLAPALAALVIASPGPGDPPGVRTPANSDSAAGVVAAWTSLEPGVELGVFPGPGTAPGDGKIWVLRLDLRRFELKLVNASASDAKPRTVRAWALGAGAVAAINAGMFQTDGLTSVGLMRTRNHQNNPRRNTRYKAVLAFDPVKPELPPVRILDATCGELDAFSPAYGTLIQSIRMVSCDRKNVWAPDAKRWSAAAIGLDGAGRALFIHARSPWPVHDLIDALLTLPLDLRRAMYVEGGPEAQLFVRAGGRELERLGALEGTVGEARAGLAWEIPNAVVAVRRTW